MRKSQTSTEYIIILAVILVIAVFVGTQLTDFLSYGTSLNKKQTDILLKNQEVAIENYGSLDSGLLIKIRNNFISKQTITRVLVNDIDCSHSFPITLNVGQNSIINCSNLNSSYVEYTSTPNIVITWINLENNAVYSTDGIGVNSGKYLTYLITEASQTLPDESGWGWPVIIGDYVYLYGGERGGWNYDYIMRAPVTDPLNWELMSDIIPYDFGWGFGATYNETIYLIGGVWGSKKVAIANFSNPTNFTDLGDILPEDFYGGGGLIQREEMVYLLGTNNTNGSAGSSITYGPLTNLSNLTVYDIDFNLRRSFIFDTGDYIYSLIGEGGGVMTLRIASSSNIFNFTFYCNVSINSTSNAGHAIVYNGYAYKFGAFMNQEIYRAPVSNMCDWNYVGNMTYNGWGDSAIEVNNKVYILGGLKSDYHGTNKIMIFEDFT